MRPRKYITGMTALGIWGTDWHIPAERDRFQIAGVDFEPLDRLFGDGEVVDCRERLERLEIPIPPELEEVPCATPVRAYLEWAYSFLKEGHFPSVDPQDLMFGEDELREVMRYLYRLRDTEEDPAVKERISLWLSHLESREDC